MTKKEKKELRKARKRAAEKLDRLRNGIERPVTVIEEAGKGHTTVRRETSKKDAYKIKGDYAAINSNFKVVAWGSTPRRAKENAIVKGCHSHVIVHSSKLTGSEKDIEEDKNVSVENLSKERVGDLLKEGSKLAKEAKKRVDKLYEVPDESIDMAKLVERIEKLEKQLNKANEKIGILENEIFLLRKKR